MTTINTIIDRLTQQLTPICSTPAAAQQEAWWLLEHAMGMSKAMLLARPTFDVLPEVQQKLDAMVAQRVTDHKPLQYILGCVPFCDLEIMVQPPILIPRSETEEMTAWVIEQYAVCNSELRILDLCTGTGCIALALARALPQATVVGVDINPQAVALAEKNRQRHAITNATFVQSDLFAALEGLPPFDLIISNPPYIPDAEYQALPSDVKAWEDRSALWADEQGMMIYRCIIEQAQRFLKGTDAKQHCSRPCLVFEVGTNPEGVKSLLSAHGFSTITTHTDMQGVIRWLVAWR